MSSPEDHLQAAPMAQPGQTQGQGRVSGVDANVNANANTTNNQEATNHNSNSNGNGSDDVPYPYPHAELGLAASGDDVGGFQDVDIHMNQNDNNTNTNTNNDASIGNSTTRTRTRNHGTGGTEDEFLQARRGPSNSLFESSTSTSASTYNTPIKSSDPRRSHNNYHDNNNDHDNDNHISSSTFLTSADVSTIQRLDADYEKALLRREIGWNARYISVRQNAGLSLWSFFLIVMCGTIFFELNTDWTISESLLFSVYTITTVGYGNHPIPKESKVLLFISLYIFVGIAMLTILAAQLYQWIVLELTWRQYERDNKQNLKRHKQNIKTSEEMGATIGEMPMSLVDNGRGRGVYEVDEEEKQKTFCDKVFDTMIEVLNKVQAYIKNNPSGQLIVVMVPFSLLILLGAIVVGSIERWDPIESIYFAVVSMTTVGFGDYFPNKFASTWFCIVWLPFSVGFLSLYLGSIANLYIHISEKNVKRIERKLHRQVYEFRNEQNREREEAIARGTSAGFGLDIDSGGATGTMDDTTMTAEVNANVNVNTPHAHAHSHLNQPRRQGRSDRRARGVATLVANDSYEMEEEGAEGSSPERRRQNVMMNSGVMGRRFDGNGNGNGDNDLESSEDEAMKTMRNTIAAVKLNMTTRGSGSAGGGAGVEESPSRGLAPSDSEILNIKSTRHYNTTRGVEKKPTFALRVLLQERFSYIIAREIAGYQSSVEIKNNTLSVTIDSLKYTADKWMIPRKARKAFRAVAFEVLYFCGERDLIVRGAEAVFDLRPHEAQGLFAPLLAAFGDADTMEAWLMRTQTMTENELTDEYNDEESSDEKLRRVEEMRARKVTQNMTAAPNVKRNVIGNAVTNQSS